MSNTMKKITVFLLSSASLFTVVQTASAHLTGGSFGEHGTYWEELTTWPPQLRQLHYYAEAGAIVFIVGFVILGVFRRIRDGKK